MKTSVIFLLACQCLSLFVSAAKPSFQQQFPYFFYVEENSPKGHLIGDVNASVANSNQQITYETSIIPGGVIIISNTTGALYVNGSIDADIPEVHDIQFTVYAYINPNEKASIKIYVIINDVNDNPPVFQNQPYKVNISEDFPLNTYVTRVRATDVDRKGHSELIYNIEGWNKDSMFFIKEFEGTIWTNKRLDYEKDRKHVLNVSVTDGRPSIPGRHFVYTTVEVYVTDYDDQGAKFDEYNYYCSIQEGVHNGSKLIQVHAADLDKGINSPVSYSIYQANNPGGIYQIDSTTGLITVQGTIDREATGSSFYLTVKAISTIHAPATAIVVISINDTNDNAPFFPNNHYTGTVLENSMVGSKVFQVSAVDLDEGPHKELAYSIVGGSGKFDIDSSGFVLVNGSLDREKVDIYNFQVYAVERLTKEKFSNLTNVTIFIKDVNDNSPKFAKNVFEFEVEEEVTAPLFISQLNATDSDYGANGFIEFSIIPDAENKHKDFYIEPLTGKLFTQRKLDRERIAAYSMLIKATDRAAPGQKRETLCTVKVTVNDVNDNIPHFSEPNYKTSVNEAANINTIVFALQAHDADIGANAELRYDILQSNVSQYFKIDPTSGIIKTSKELDREMISVFHLDIIVKDGGNKSSKANVTIIILDINDNSPVFTRSNGYHFNVTEGKQGEFVGVVQAYDIDEGDAGKVKYAITDNENFAIDPQNGTIITARKLDREYINIHRITVVAEDLSKIGPRNSYTQVEVKVIDKNDNAPEFANSGEFSTVIRKESAQGTFVFRFSAVDKDNGENSKVSYALEPQFKEMFSLENSTGILRIQSSFSNYTNATVAVRVIAHDNGIPKLMSTARLQIYSANVLKSAPVFERPFIKASIKENEARGKLVVDVTASYNGRSNEEEFRYSIIHGNTAAFQMNEENGRITTLKSMDREIFKSHVLIIMVQLRLQNDANFATVEVTVEDVNDNPPLFAEETFKVNIYENQENKTVATVLASDKDDGINSKISYFLNGSDSFKIDKDSGVISTTRSLDREEVAEYNLSVTAVNEYASPKLNSSCKIIVNVLDLNDNAPLFEKKIYHAAVVENVPVNTSVTQVKAHDLDKGINSYIKYDIQENKCFYIDWRTGVIRTACLIDREKIPSFELTLIAKGIVSPSLSSTALLIVNVTDVDDNHPHFPAKMFRLEPNENLKVGSKLVTFHAIDADAFVGDVSYKIHSGNSDGYFLLNDLTGVLTLSKQLDRESRSSFKLEVRVYSRMKTRKKRAIDNSTLHCDCDQTTVLIIIQDANDNSPFFIKTNYTVAIREDAVPKTAVAKVHANDSDSGMYGSVSYKTDSGNQNGLFHLEKLSGIITVYKSLVGDAGKETKMIISASDNNGAPPSNPSVNAATLHIYVIGDAQTGILSIEAAANYIYSYIHEYESVLSSATEATAKIDSIKPTSDKNKFLVYFHAIDEGTSHVLSEQELLGLIDKPKYQFVKDQLKKYNITWYQPMPTPGKVASSSENESNYEIYIGVITAIAILLIITCAFAIWAGHFKKSGRNQRDISGNEARTNTLETIPNGYYMDSVRSLKSANRYIIEPYESNEQVEKDDKQAIDNETGLSSSPFYTVEAHEEEVSMGTQRGYLDSSAASQLTHSWAYGDTESIASQGDFDDIIAEKTPNLHSSYVEIDVIGYQEKNSTSTLGAGGPLFTSEKMDEFAHQDNESSEELVNDDSTAQDSSEAHRSNDASRISIEQPTNESRDENSHCEYSTDSQRIGPHDSTDGSLYPASSPSFLQFESVEWEPAGELGSPTFETSSTRKDANGNETPNEIISCHHSQFTALKTLNADGSTDNEQMDSYL